MEVENYKTDKTNFNLCLREMETSQKDEYLMETCERKALRIIYDAINDRGLWGTCFNFELYHLYKEPNI